MARHGDGEDLHSMRVNGKETCARKVRRQEIVLFTRRKERGGMEGAASAGAPLPSAAEEVGNSLVLHLRNVPMECSVCDGQVSLCVECVLYR